MATYAETRARIADEMANDGDITTSQINNAILSTIADYSGEPFWFNQKSATFNTVASQENYTSTDLADIPNIIKLLSMRVYNSGSYTSYINGLDNDAIEDIQDGTMRGAPQFYARFENKIRMYPIPDAVYPIRIAYITTLATLSADSDTNAWLSDGEEVIRQGAKKRLAADILGADDLANRFARMEQEAYDGLRSENRARRSQQFLRTDLPMSPRAFNINTGW